MGLGNLEVNASETIQNKEGIIKGKSNLGLMAKKVVSENSLYLSANRVGFKTHQFVAHEGIGFDDTTDVKILSDNIINTAPLLAENLSIIGGKKLALLNTVKTKDSLLVGTLSDKSAYLKKLYAGKNLVISGVNNVDATIVSKGPLAISKTIPCKGNTPFSLQGNFKAAEINVNVGNSPLILESDKNALRLESKGDIKLEGKGLGILNTQMTADNIDLKAGQGNVIIGQPDYKPKFTARKGFCLGETAEISLLNASIEAKGNIRIGTNNSLLTIGVDEHTFPDFKADEKIGLFSKELFLKNGHFTAEDRICLTAAGGPLYIGTSTTTPSFNSQGTLL